MSSINKEEVDERNNYVATLLRLFADKIECGYSDYTIGCGTGYTPETTQDNMQRMHGLSTPLNHGKLNLDFQCEISIDEEELHKRFGVDKQVKYLSRLDDWAKEEYVDKTSEKYRVLENLILEALNE